MKMLNLVEFCRDYVQFGIDTIKNTVFAWHKYFPSGGIWLIYIGQKPAWSMQKLIKFVALVKVAEDLSLSNLWIWQKKK